MSSRSLLAIAFAGFAGFAAVAHADDAPALEFRTAVRGDQGVVRCGLFTEKGWLKTPVQGTVARIRAGVALCVFKGVPKGVYGISAFHDKNNNGKLDTNFIGLPTEDYCASRDARNTFGPPSFADAKFSYAGGVKRLSARMK
ncbi:MAG: DUF2141 domain-containing protein [Polyangiaceae bacterium]